MYQKIKRFFYFFVASYFRFFAKIRLVVWHPRIIVITGSSGKTTLLHMVESQLGDIAKYSHEANSSFGIPFDILGIHRKALTIFEWPWLFVKAPFGIFRSLPREKIYVVEADCDRPQEGRFLSNLLQPEATLWTNVYRTHSANFDKLVGRKGFGQVEDAIAYEFGFFAEETRKLLIVNGDDPFEGNQLKRTRADVVKVSSRKTLIKYRVNLYKTEFDLNGDTIGFSYLLPKEIANSILMSKKIVEYLGLDFNKKFPGLALPPGRNSFFRGIKGITIVDSTYNANFDSMKAVITMFADIEAKNKWVVLGDMLEQGRQEKEEHEKLANLVSKFEFDKIILMGPRISKYTKPLLSRDAIAFISPREVLDYLKHNIRGGEIILFKGARFLEGVVENLLLDKNEARLLARREKIWEIRRKKWGL